jgi:hypothetical protein
MQYLHIKKYNILSDIIYKYLLINNIEVTMT